MIKVMEPHLHQIKVMVPGFLITNPILEGVQQVELPLLRIVKEVATPSHPAIKEEEEIVDIF